MSASIEARIAEYAAAPTPPLPVASPPLPLPSPLTTSPTDAGAPLGYRAARIQMRAATASPPLLLPSTSHRTDVPEAEMPSRKRTCYTTPAPRLEIRESSAAGAARRPEPTPEADAWDEIVEAIMEIAPTTLEGVDQRVTELDTIVRQGTEEFQVRFEEAYDDRAYLRARVNTLFRDRPYHHHTALALDREVVYARIAWTGSEERSATIEAHVRTLEARDPEPQDGPAEAGSSWPSYMIIDVVCMDVDLFMSLLISLSVVYFTKMPQKRRTTRATPATTTAPTTTVTDAQLQALIDQGVAAALAERDASRSRDGR
ncbi:hypothetical protein Tco_1496588 [Tanacetum coccineum]